MGVGELARRLGVSEMTVRRDLDELERQGMVERVRGGARATGTRERGWGSRRGSRGRPPPRTGLAPRWRSWWSRDRRCCWTPAPPPCTSRRS
ncbi:DeoR family transcriptional regulator [Kitasatospora gansuensis]